MERCRKVFRRQERNHMVMKINDNAEKNINEKIDEQYNGHKNNDISDHKNNNETIFIPNHSRDKGIESKLQKDSIEYQVDFDVSDEGEVKHTPNNHAIDSTRNIITDVDDKYLQDDIQNVVHLLDNTNLFYTKDDYPYIQDVEYNKEIKPHNIHENINTNNYITDLYHYEYNMNKENYPKFEQPTEKNIDEEKINVHKDDNIYEDYPDRDMYEDNINYEQFSDRGMHEDNKNCENHADREIYEDNKNCENHADRDIYEDNKNCENHADRDIYEDNKNCEHFTNHNIYQDNKNCEHFTDYDNSNIIYISQNNINKNIDYDDNMNYTLKDKEKKDIYTEEQKSNEKDKYDENTYIEKLDENIYKDMNKYVETHKDTYDINEKDKDTIIWYNNQFTDKDKVKNICDINLIETDKVEKKCPITYSEETKEINNKMLTNYKEDNIDNMNKNISNNDKHYKIDSHNFVNNNMKYIKKQNSKEKKKKKKNIPVQNDDNTIFIRTNNKSKKYNIIQNMLYNDKHINNIFDKTVKEFETKIDKLNNDELKNKITKMFVNELVSEKYNDILLEEEKGTLKKILTIKYKDIFLKKKKKFEKYIKRFLLKKLKNDEKILKQNYEKEKEKFQKYIMNIKDEELEKEKKKIEQEFKLLQESYLKKMNIYISDINNIKDIFTNEIKNKFNLQNISNIQNKLVNLQNCIIHDLSIEHILIELKKDLQKDIYLNKFFKILPSNFFSHIFKPSNNNEKLKKEFYYLYQECVQRAFLNKDDNYFKQILGKIMSSIYIKYEPTLNNILIRSSKNSILKNNLLNLSFALNSIQQNKLIDALRYTNDLTGNCKEIFSSFNEHIKNVILFKFYLRLVVSRIMLASKTLRLHE